LSILHLGLFEHLVSKVSAQEIWGMQFDFSAEQLRKFILHIKETKSRHISDLELYQHVHIAVGGKIIPQS